MSTRCAHSGSAGPIVSEFLQFVQKLGFKHFVISQKLLGQSTQVECQSFWDWQNAYFCIGSAAVLAEHNALTLRSIGPIVSEIDKMFKTSFLQIAKQCIRRSATCWAERLDTQVDCPIVSEIWENVQNLFLQIEETTVHSAQRPAEHNTLTLRSIGPIVSEIDKMFKTLFFIEKTTVYSAQRYLLSTTYWANRPECQRVVLSR